MTVPNIKSQFLRLATCAPLDTGRSPFGFVYSVSHPMISRLQTIARPKLDSRLPAAHILFFDCYFLLESDGDEHNQYTNGAREGEAIQRGHPCASSRQVDWRHK